MAFPTIPTAAAGRVLTILNTAGGATKTFPSLSSLTKNAGDLLIAICIMYDGNSTNAEFSGWGGGFTEFGDFATTTGVSIGCAYKFSTGSETGTFTVTTADTSANDSVLFLLAIPGAHASTAPEAGGYVVAVGANPDSGSLDPAGWGTEDTLWIAVAGSGEDSTTGTFTAITAAPTNYTNLVASAVTADVVGGMYGALAFRQLNAGSENPGAFSADISNTRSGAITIAVRPKPPTTTPVAEISLASHGDPSQRTNHSIKVRARTTAGSTGVLYAALYEGGTNRSGDLVSTTLTNSLANYTLAISDAAAATITSYANLSVRVWGYDVNGGALVFEVAELYLNLPASAGAAPTTDAATIQIFITPSTSDTADLIDSAFVPFIHDTIGTLEIAQFIDAATPYVDIQVSGVDVKEIPDAATVLVDLSNSSVEAAQFVDASTVPFVDIVAASAETAQYVDTATPYVDIQTLATEIAGYVDATTTPVLLSASGADTAQYVDAATSYIDVDTSAGELAAYVESATALVLISVSSAEIHEIPDQATVLVDLDCSGSDVYTVGGVTYTETATAFIDLDTSAVEIREIPDAATVLIDLQVIIVGAAAIAHDATSSNNDGLALGGGGISSLTLSHTIGAGSNRVLVVTAAVETGAGAPAPNFLSAAYNGVALTQVGNIANPTEVAGDRIGQWYMLEADLPAAGTYNVVVTMVSPVEEIIVVATSAFNVRQEAPVTNSAGTEVDGSTFSTNITTSYDNSWVFDGISSNTDQTVWTPDAGQDLRGNVHSAHAVGNGLATSTKLVAVAGSTTLGWTATVANYARTGQVLAAFGPAVGAGEIAQFVDADTPYVDIQASGSDVYTGANVITDAATALVDIDTSSVEVHEIPDTATVFVDLQTSAVEIREIPDTATVTVVLGTSAVEVHEIPDTAIVLVDLDLSSVEEHTTFDSAAPYVDLTTSATETKEISDAATPYVDVTCSSADIAQFVDAPSVGLLISVSATEGIEHTETGAPYVDVQPNTVDTAQFVDSATASVLLSVTGVDIVQLVDAATVTVDLNCSGTDLHEIPDQATSTVVITPSSVDTAQYVEAGTTLVDLDCSGVDLLPGQIVDAATVPITLSTTGVDTLQAVDSATSYVDIDASAIDIAVEIEATTVYVDVNCSATDVADFVDSAVTLVDLSTSGSDVIVAADADAPYVDISCSATDVHEIPDAASVYVDVDGSTVEDYSRFDAAVAYVDLDCSGTDVHFVAGSGYVDSATPYVDVQTTTTDVAVDVEQATCYVTITPSTADTAQYVDIANVLVDLDCSGTEGAGGVDSATPYVDVSCSTLENYERLDADAPYVDIAASTVDFSSFIEQLTVPVLLAPSGLEQYTQVLGDAALVPLHIYVSPIEIHITAIQPQLEAIGGLVLRWATQYLGLRWTTEDATLRWQSKAERVRLEALNAVKAWQLEE